jgi:hypothetical protein
MPVDDDSMRTRTLRGARESPTIGDASGSNEGSWNWDRKRSRNSVPLKRGLGIPLRGDSCGIAGSSSLAEGQP